MKPRVLFTHQWKSAGGLYGSDKVLLDLLAHTAAFIEPIVVIESDGVFADLARAIPCEVLVRNLGVLRQKQMTPGGMLSCSAHTLRSAFWLARYIRAQRVSLVVSNTVSVLAGAFAAKLSRRPHLWLIHEILEGKAQLLSPVVKHLSTRIVAVSHASAQSLHASAKTLVAYPGVSVTRFDKANVAPLRERHGIPAGVVLIGMVGRIHHWKGQGYFLNALHELKRRGITNFRGLIIGDVYAGYENLKRDLQGNVQRLALQDRVIFCGHQHEIEPVMKALDIVVAPSTRPDPFCLVVAEAMAAGRPVVSTNWGGPKEIIEDHVSGMLIPPDGPAAFADRLDQLIRYPELRRNLGSAGRKSVEERFSRGAFNHQVSAALQSLLT